MDYTKNFKAKNIIVRVISFIIYFFVSGFMGKLCAIIMEPAFTLILKLSKVNNYQKIENITLYIVSIVVMFAAVSFFSRREGYNDTELLRFNFGKTVISYLSAGIIFCFLAIIAVIFNGDYNFLTIIREYFLTPYFFPEDINKLISDIIYFPDNSILYNIFEKIKYFLLLKWTSLCLTVSVNILFTVIFYGKGRNRWTEKKNRRILHLKEIEKSKKSRK
ncbi:MAG: hypothetical protein FWD71_12485 [Oscillospiraceae bacterium]|nr:hypothetical protein [Oscillospiraceae bacterium]